jgi:hypothetical protein
MSMGNKVCYYTSENLKIHVNNTEAIDSVKNYKTLTSSALSILATCSSSQSRMTVLLRVMVEATLTITKFYKVTQQDGSVHR